MYEKKRYICIDKVNSVEIQGFMNQSVITISV